VANKGERFLYIEAGLRRGIEIGAMPVPGLALGFSRSVPRLVGCLISNEHDQKAFNSEIVFRA
jgi:hypothetical protein